MRRDAKLIFKLMLFVEQKGSRLFKGAIIIDGHERDEVIHHVYLLADAGFIELGRDTIADKGPLVLTWKGCDYLDELREKYSRSSKATTSSAKPSKTAAKPTAKTAPLTNPSPPAPEPAPSA